MKKFLSLALAVLMLAVMLRWRLDQAVALIVLILLMLAAT